MVDFQRQLDNMEDGLHEMAGTIVFEGDVNAKAVINKDPELQKQEEAKNCRNQVVNTILIWTISQRDLHLI